MMTNTQQQQVNHTQRTLTVTTSFGKLAVGNMLPCKVQQNHGRRCKVLANYHNHYCYHQNITTSGRSTAQLVLETHTTEGNQHNSTKSSTTSKPQPKDTWVCAKERTWVLLWCILHTKQTIPSTWNIHYTTYNRLLLSLHSTGHKTSCMVKQYVWQCLTLQGDTMWQCVTWDSRGGWYFGTVSYFWYWQHTEWLTMVRLGILKTRAIRFYSECATAAAGILIYKCKSTAACRAVIGLARNAAVLHTYVFSLVMWSLFLFLPRPGWKCHTSSQVSIFSVIVQFLTAHWQLPAQ